MRVPGGLSVEHEILDSRVMCLSPHVGVEMIFKKEKNLDGLCPWLLEGRL